MSKKSEIVELLKNGTDTDEICTELEVSQSYVYRLKREMDESKGDKKESSDTEGDNSDGVVIDPTGGAGDNVEGNNKNVDKKEQKGSSNESDGMGGVKKKRKRTKKVKKTEQNEQSEQSEHTGGLKAWIVKQWKKMLLILTLLILLVAMMLSSSKPVEKTQNQNPSTPQSRFPVITT